MVYQFDYLSNDGGYGGDDGDLDITKDQDGDYSDLDITKDQDGDYGGSYSDLDITKDQDGSYDGNDLTNDLNMILSHISPIKLLKRKHFHVDNNIYLCLSPRKLNV